MSKPAHDTTSRPRDETDVGRVVSNLAEEMRGTVTLVVGYLELISAESAAPSDQHLNWITTLERQLEAMRELNDRVAKACGVLRESVSHPEAAARRGPEGLEG